MFVWKDQMREQAARDDLVKKLYWQDQQKRGRELSTQKWFKFSDAARAATASNDRGDELKRARLHEPDGPSGPELPRSLSEARRPREDGHRHWDAGSNDDLEGDVPAHDDAAGRKSGEPSTPTTTTTAVANLINVLRSEFMTLESCCKHFSVVNLIKAL